LPRASAESPIIPTVNQKLDTVHMVKSPADRPTRPQRRQGDADGQDSEFFTTVFQERDEDTAALVPWSERAKQLETKASNRAKGGEMLARIWGSEHYSAAMGDGGLKRLAGFMQFIEVKADCEVIAQDERGDYLLIILDGTVAVDRVQPWGGRVRLGESRPGDILGEMSLLDAGTRFSACRTLTPCTLGVLEASEMDRMMNDDPRLAAALMAALARRLSLRLRQASARLSALLAQG
jgi:hypothetical protein